MYTLDEAQKPITDERELLTKAEEEARRLETEADIAHGSDGVDELRKQLEVLRDQNLDQATFTDRPELPSRMGLKVYPAEDLRSVRVECQLGTGVPRGEQGNPTLAQRNTERAEPEAELACGKVSSAPP